MLRQRWGYGPVPTLKTDEMQGADASAARLTPIPEHFDGRRFFNPHSPPARQEPP